MNYVDHDRKTAFVDGREIDLPPKCFQVAALLASRPGVVFSHQAILRHMGSPHARLGVATDYIKRIRSLGVACIKTRTGMGFVWLAEGTIPDPVPKQYRRRAP